VVKDFKNFLLEGDLVSVAVGLVMALVTTAVIKALVADIITPIVALIFGRPSFENLSFTINSSHFLYGDLINSIVTFLTTGFAVFFFVVKPYNAFRERTRRTPDPDSDMRPCTECCSDIPKAATRCAFCTSVQTPLSA
jgi:large conductance mechanosensitive channel